MDQEDGRREKPNLDKANGSKQIEEDVRQLTSITNYFKQQNPTT